MHSPLSPGEGASTQGDFYLDNGSTHTGEQGRTRPIFTCNMPPKGEAAVKVIAQTKEERIATVSGPLRHHKGHSTRNLNTLRAILKGIDDWGPGLSTIQELTRQLSEIEEYREKIDSLCI